MNQNKEHEPGCHHSSSLIHDLKCRCICTCVNLYMTKTKTLEQLIDSWHFDYVNSDIKNFPIEEVRSNEYKIFNFDRYISSEDASKEMEKAGYLPANLNELLNWKEWNGKDSVVSLGSVGGVRGDRDVACLDMYGSERGLRLYWWDGGWFAHYRFLGVRNLSFSTESLDSDALGNLGSLTLAIAEVKKAGYVIYKPI